MLDTLFRFVKQVASLAQKLTDAALMELSDPAENIMTQRNLKLTLEELLQPKKAM